MTAHDTSDMEWGAGPESLPTPDNLLNSFWKAILLLAGLTAIVQLALAPFL